MEYEQRDDEINRLKEQLGRLVAQVQHLEQARHVDAHQIQNLTQASALQNVLTQGLDAIREQLEPLRDLTPSRTHLDETRAATLAALRRDAERPLWNGDPAFEKRDYTTAIGRRSYDSRTR